METVETIECLKRAADLSRTGRTSMPAYRASTGDLDMMERKDLRRHLDEAVCGSRPDLALEEMRRNGLIHYLRAVPGLIGFGGGSQGHKDLWDHTKRVVLQSEPTPVIRWAALYHDVGKPMTMVRRGGDISFHGHEFVSAREFRKMAAESDLFREDGDRIGFLVENLGRVESFTPEWTDSAVRRLMSDLGGALEDLLSLSSADITTGREAKRHAILESISTLRRRMTEIRKEDGAPKLPKGLGLILSRELNIPQSRALGDLMKALEKALGDGRIPARSSADFYVEFAREHFVNAVYGK